MCSTPAKHFQRKQSCDVNILFAFAFRRKYEPGFTQSIANVNKNKITCKKKMEIYKRALHKLNSGRHLVVIFGVRFWPIALTYVPWSVCLFKQFVTTALATFILLALSVFLCLRRFSIFACWSWGLQPNCQTSLGGFFLGGGCCVFFMFSFSFDCNISNNMLLLFFLFHLIAIYQITCCYYSFVRL